MITSFIGRFKIWSVNLLKTKKDVTVRKEVSEAEKEQCICLKTNLPYKIGAHHLCGADITLYGYDSFENEIFAQKSAKNNQVYILKISLGTEKKVIC